MPLSVNEGLWRIGAQWGEARDARDGSTLSEVVNVTATTTINRIDIPLVGSQSTGHKPGRITREGTFRFQKMDSRWEIQAFQFLNQSLEQRRANRNAGRPSLAPFNLYIVLDDPEALDYEEWLLEGCLIWALPLGYDITGDIIDRDINFSYERETPQHTFERDGTVNDTTGLPNIVKDDHGSV